MYLNILRIAISTIVIAIITYFTSVFIGNETIEASIKKIAASDKSLREFQFYNESIQSTSQLSSLYRERDYKPFWIKDNALSSQAQELLKVINYTEFEGLHKKDYHSQAIEEILNIRNNVNHISSDSLAKTDILLTDAFVTLSIHMYAGVISGNGMNVNRQNHLKKLNLFAAIDSALKYEKVMSVLLSFANPSPAYQLLKHNLQYNKFIQADGGFPVLPNDLVLNIGDKSEIIPVLCKRLQLTNELKAFYSNTIYDTVIAKGIKHFQYQHGLPETGLLTKETIAELNVPVEERIRQIEINMERWRWLPRKHADTVVMVNIPGFTMEVFERMQPKLVMRAIVGKEYTQTPVFYANMQYLVINPYWDVPHSIATKEIFPQLKRNPSYLANNHMLLYHKNDVNNTLNPYNIDWGLVTSENFPYRIRQKPGEWNALGDIKFIFPNPYNVYLHGTPSINLFEKPVRAFSHGCIRIEAPVDLAEYLLNYSKTWPAEKIRNMIKTRQEKVVKLPHKLPIYVCYWTCWPDKNGELNFRNDVYGHDVLLARAFYNDRTRSISRR